MKITLINPRFEMSYWGLELALPLFGKRANLPVAALPLLAALTPPGYAVELIDENVEPIDFDRIVRSDIVGVTGMSVQRARMKEIMAELKRRGAFVVVGGPWVTVQENYFGNLADVIFVGEAEETWPAFLEDWQRGNFARRYEQAQKTDMSKVPTPRFDLLKMRHYMYGSIQFSRGCPFQCEFCDIIVTFGRRPRLKTSAQIIAELEALRAQGIRTAFIVDDNLIGNKKAVKALLADLTGYQRATGYYFDFFTEASLDLAEQEELMRLMVEANINDVFIGIESPNEEALREAKKSQNLSVRRSLVERVHRIQHAGIEVLCGMIVGFDNDTPDIFAAQHRFLKEARISTAMIGMLSAIPKTPLYARLAAENRLDSADSSSFGTNVIPLRMSREALRDGFLLTMREVYEPASYFDRVDELYLGQKIQLAQGLKRYWAGHRWNALISKIAIAIMAFVVLARLAGRVGDAGLRSEYLRRVCQAVRARRDVVLAFNYVLKCALHFHHYGLAQRMASGEKNVINTF